MIEKVFVISLKKRQDRLKKFFLGLPKPWILNKIIVFEGIDGQKEVIPKWWELSKGAWGCYLSHLSIIEYCLKNKVKSVLIFEDDAIFNKNFNYEIKKALNSLPKDWEMCYLGGQHLKKPKPEIIDMCLGIGTNINRTHAYMLSYKGCQKIYKYIINTNWPSKKYHIDHYYGYLQENNIIKAYCCLDMLVGQDEGLSDVVDFNFPKRWWN
jgi:GR25 family glycosyltransferase involved in LPS biosynthesis